MNKNDNNINFLCNWAEGVVLVAENDIAQCIIISLDREYRIFLPLSLFPKQPITTDTFRIGMATDENGQPILKIEMIHIKPSMEVLELHSKIDAMLANFKNKCD